MSGFWITIGFVASFALGALLATLVMAARTIPMLREAAELLRRDCGHPVFPDPNEGQSLNLKETR